MATSGSKRVTVEKLFDAIIFLEFNWTTVHQDISNNASTISWELKFCGEGGGWYNSTYREPYKVTVNGATYEGKSNLKIGKNGSVTIVSGEEVIQHNPDGTGTFDFSFYVEFNGWEVLPRSKSGSGTGELEPLARHTVFSTAPNFTDEDNPTITFIDPLNGGAHSVQACISFTGWVDDIPYREIPNTISRTYTFNLTNAERATLRSKLAPGVTSTTVMFIIKTVINEGDAPQRVSLTRTLTYVNYEPTLNPRVWATDGLTKELTGDSNGGILIKNHSTVSFYTGAQARKGATIEYQRISNGNQELDDYTSNTGTFTNVTSTTFYFSATDSRGNTTRDAVVFSIDNGKFVEYFKPTCSIKSTQLDSNGYLTFTIVGKFFNGSFGAQNNTFEIDYGLKEEGGDIVWYRTGFLTPYVDSEGNYECTYTASGLNYRSQYELDVYVVDAITNSSTSSKVLAATTIFDWSKDDFAHHTDVVMDNGKNIVGTRADGATFRAIETCNGGGNMVLNWDSYEQGSSDTEVYGNNVKLAAKGNVYINNRAFGEQKVLWNGGGWNMNASQRADLSEPISAQPNGIVLVFSLMRNGNVEDASLQSFFISKKEVSLIPGKSHTFFMMINSGFSVIGAKYLEIHDTHIWGNDTNTLDGTNNGLTFKNSMFVLRYVIGV